MKKTVSQVALIIGVFVSIIGIIIDAFSINLITTIGLNSIALVFAIAFVFSKKKNLVYVGYVIAGIIGACALTMLLIPLDRYDISIGLVSNIGYILMGVASLIFYFVEMLRVFGFVKAKDKETAVDVMVVLNKYKEMEKENVITIEEFEALKSKLLKGAEKEISSVEDLKKWKKLYDQKVITEDEFAKVKSNIFAK